MAKATDAVRARRLRCAVYTRKSSEEGLEQEFNSLHAQREACEAFIRSQRHEGWVCLPQAYDDGGFSGGTCSEAVAGGRFNPKKTGPDQRVPVIKVAIVLSEG